MDITYFEASSVLRPCVHRDRLIRRPCYEAHGPRATGYLGRTSAPPTDNNVTAIRAEQQPVIFNKKRASSVARVFR